MGSRAGQGRGDGSLGLSEPLLTGSTTDRGVASGPLHASRAPPQRVGAHSHAPSQHSLPLGTAPRDVRAVARRGFRPLRGAWLVLLTWAGTCVATLWALLTDERGLIGPFDDAHAARASLNAALLLASGALELTLRHVLKRRQRQGYLAFYRGVRKLIPQPFRIVSLGTAVLFVIVTTGWSVEAARAVATLQCAAMVGCLLAIGEQIRRHNAAAPSPDARVALGRGCEESDVLSNAHWDGSHVGWDDVEDGFVGDEASVSEEQAEFNRYLCEQVRELGRECVRLQRRLAEKRGEKRGTHSRATTTRTISTVSLATTRTTMAKVVKGAPPSAEGRPPRSSRDAARSSRDAPRSWTSGRRRWRGCTRRTVSTSRNS